MDEDGVVHYSDRTHNPSNKNALSNGDLPVINTQQPPEDIDYFASPKKITVTGRKKNNKHQDCTKVKDIITAIEKKLRRGYKEPKGNALRQS